MSDRLEAILFPDVAFHDDVFLKSCLVYFDAIRIPRRGAEPLEESEIDMLHQLLSGGATSSGSSSDKERRGRLLTLLDRVEHLRGEGIVDFWDDTLWLQAIDACFIPSSDYAARGGVPETSYDCAQDASTWIESEELFSHTAGPIEYKKLHYSRYSQQALTRLYVAHQTGCHVVTNENRHLAELRQMQQGISPGSIPRTTRGSTELLRCILPHLVAREIEDVVEIREKLRDFLSPLRTEIAKIAAAIPEGISDADLRIEVQRRVDAEVEPHLQSLRDYLRSPSRVLAKHLASSTGAMLGATVALLGSALLDLDLSAAAAAAPFAHVLTAAVKAKTEISAAKRGNPFTFVLLAEEEAAKG